MTPDNGEPLPEGWGRSRSSRPTPPGAGRTESAAYGRHQARAVPRGLSFTEALAEELSATGVHIMAAHPGGTDIGFIHGTTATTDTPARVAADTLDDYARRRAASYPGRFTNRASTVASRFLPSRTVSKVTAALNRKQGLHKARDVADTPA